MKFRNCNLKMKDTRKGVSAFNKKTINLFKKLNKKMKIQKRINYFYKTNNLKLCTWNLKIKI